MHVKPIHLLAGIPAVVVAGAALFATKPLSGMSGKEEGDRRQIAAQLQSDVPGARTRKPDSERHRRLAERLLGITGRSAMREAAKEGESDFNQIVNSFRSDDFAAVMEELAKPEGDGEFSTVLELRLKLLQVWAENDPGRAASFSIQAGAPAEACRMVAETWAKADIAAALSWARGLPEGIQRQEGLIGVGNQVVSADPRQAIQLVMDFGPSPESEELLYRAAGAWAATGPEDALNWTSEVKDVALRQRLLTAVATSWADRDPCAAAKLVIDAVDKGSLEENALVGIVQRLAIQDLPHAREWVAEFPAGNLRERAEMELARIAERTGGAKQP